MIGGLRCRREDRVAFFNCDLDAPIADDIGDADQFHIILNSHRVGNALANDAVAIDGHANFLSRHVSPLSIHDLKYQQFGSVASIAPFARLQKRNATTTYEHFGAGKIRWSRPAYQILRINYTPNLGDRWRRNQIGVISSL